MNGGHVWTITPTWKIVCNRLGPDLLVPWISPCAYKLDLPLSIQIHRVHAVSLLYRVVDDPLVGQQVDPLSPLEVDGEVEYQVLCVEDSCMY